MLSKFCEVRRKYGDTFITVFPNGFTVPWKPLTLSDFLYYTKAIDRTPVPAAFLEDEIFKKCVLDQSLVRQIDYLKAGIIGAVTQNIIEHSGPIGVDSLNSDLEMARNDLEKGGYAVLHELVRTITTAFPYTPDQVYEMQYDVFLNRFALAESKLIQLGVYKEPIKIIDKKQTPNPKRERIDAKKLYDMQQKQKRAPEPAIEKDLANLEGTGKWWKTSPMLEVPQSQKEHIDFKREQKEAELFGMSGWEQIDQEILKDKMVKEAQIIYKDALKALAKNKKK